MRTTSRVAALVAAGAPLLLLAVPTSAAPPSPAPPAAAAGTAPPVATGEVPHLAEAVAHMTPPVVNVSTRRRASSSAPASRGGPGSRADEREGELLDRLFGGDRGHGQGAARRSLGSGVIVDATGLVLTNDHVIGDADEIRVTLADEREFQARVVGRDARTDVALLKIDASGLPVAPLGDSDALRVGDRVVAVGNPFGLNQTVTSGIVSAKGRVIGAGPYDDFIQTDASINPGNSGGPLFDLRGRVVGINTAIVEKASGIGFAIPVNLIKGELSQLRQRGRVVRGFLGVTVQHVSPLLARAFALPRTGGALVTAVDPRSPAALAGVEPGDVVLSINGRPVPTSDRLAEMVAQHEPGTAVQLGLSRRGRFVQLGAVVQPLPDSDEDAGAGHIGRGGSGGGRSDRERVAGREAARPAERPFRDPLGVRVRAQSDEEQARSGSPGVVVEEVNPSGPSAGRLETGDLVLEIDHAAARTPSEFTSLVGRAGARGISEAHPLLLRVRRGESPLFVAVDRNR